MSRSEKYSILDRLDSDSYEPKKFELAQLSISEYITIYSFIRRTVAPEGLYVGGINSLLETIAIQGSVSLSRLCEILSISKSTGSLQVDKLVKNGLVRRRQDPGDRRNIILEPTDEGNRRVVEILNTKIRCLMGKFEGMSDEDIETLHSSFSNIRRILGSLDQG